MQNQFENQVHVVLGLNLTKRKAVLPTRKDAPLATSVTSVNVLPHDYHFDHLHLGETEKARARRHYHDYNFCGPY